MASLQQYFLPLACAGTVAGAMENQVCLTHDHLGRGNPIMVQLSCRDSKDPLLSITHPCRTPKVRIQPFTLISPCPKKLQPEETRRQESTDFLSLPSHFHAVMPSVGFIPGTPVTSTSISNSLLPIPSIPSHSGYPCSSSFTQGFMMPLPTFAALYPAASQHVLQPRQPSPLAKTASKWGLSCY